jgi:transposase
MDPRIRYCVELDELRNLPDSRRIRAENHFLILKEYLDVYLKEQAKCLGDNFSLSSATKAYCALKKVPQRTFYNWLRAYRQRGIAGLIPQYGIEDRENKPIAHRKKKGEKYIMTITIDILVGKSPLALTELGKVIAASPLISPGDKSSFAKAFKRICALASQKAPLKLKTPLTKEEINRLELYRAGNHKKHSAKAAAILMMNDGNSMLDIGLEANAPVRTIYRWRSEFNEKRLGAIETKPFSQARIETRELRTTRVVDILHKMPALYGINRSSWTYGAIADAYEKEYAMRISKTIVQNTIKNTGYSWRHARKVLTSPDPNYKAKVERLLDTLQSLKDGECFFFIDEVGPYRVKKYGGRRLALEDENVIIPERQRTKGKVQFVAALEALTNQVTWLFSETKGSDALVALLERLIMTYSKCTKLFLTWDAIGVHSSKVIRAWISDHNQKRVSPLIEVVPLPANSQFLNVIEAVFCGMKRAVICNSDYATAKEMQDAIARHFETRNQYYKDNPKRAGNKIWDREKFDLEKLAGGLFKRM